MSPSWANVTGTRCGCPRESAVASRAPPAPAVRDRAWPSPSSTIAPPSPRVAAVLRSSSLLSGDRQPAEIRLLLIVPQKSAISTAFRIPDYRRARLQQLIVEAIVTSDAQGAKGSH